MSRPTGDELAKDGFTEAYDADIDRVDLVGGAANGHKFLMAKGDSESMIPADDVRALIKQFDEENTMAAPTDTAIEKADVALDDLIEAAPAGSTADSVPGSEDWEEKDADSATNVLSALGRVRAAVEYLQGREATEDATGTDDDAWENEWNLGDAAGALDYAIQLVAGYAAGETLEAEMQEEIDAVTKAVAAIPPAALNALDAATRIEKAGRVLSASNETELRNALESITKVLGSLPEVPEADPTPVEKTETETPAETVEKTETAEPEPVTKDDADPSEEDAASMVLVYDQQGNIIGAVDPTAITTFAATPSGQSNGDEPAAGDEPTTADLEPAPASTAGTDADATASTVTKGTSQPEAITAESLIKEAEDSDDPRTKALADIVKGLQEKVELYKSQPATPGTISNGGPLPTEANLRGQDNGAAAATDTAKVGDLRKQMHEGETVADREQAANALQALATERLTALRATATPIGGR